MKKGTHKEQAKIQCQQVSESVTSSKEVVTDSAHVKQAIIARLNNLENQVKNLSSESSRKTRHIQSLQKQLHDVKQDNKRLVKENKDLRSLLTKTPDDNRPVGGQLDHKGTTLHQSEHIDKVGVMEQVSCTNCSENLSGAKGKVVERRQVIDIFIPQKIVTEYISFEKMCPVCGKN